MFCAEYNKPLLGRPASETDFAGLSPVYALDQAGNAYQKTNRLSEVTRTTYDALNRSDPRELPQGRHQRDDGLRPGG